LVLHPFKKFIFSTDELSIQILLIDPLWGRPFWSVDPKGVSHTPVDLIEKVTNFEYDNGKQTESLSKLKLQFLA
jgi:hypothetical protein